MTYMEQMVDDIIDYIKEQQIKITEENRDELQEKLNHDLWCEDSVTGNASGSYFFNSWKAKECVMEDGEKYIFDLVQDFEISSEEVAKHFLNGDWEWWDVSIRCYLLGSAIDEALDAIMEGEE